MQTLRRLAQTILPLVVLSYGAFYGAVWAQNLFTGWAVFLVLSGMLVCVGVPYMASEDPDELRDVDVTIETDWIRVLSRLTAITELATVVAMGWWWTAILYTVGWILHWFSRLLYAEAVDRIEDKEEGLIDFEQTPSLN